MQTAWVILVLGCSYMIYSPAFDALSQEAKDAVYRRIWEGLAANRGRIAARPSKFCARPGRDSPTTSGPERLAQGAGAAPSPSGPLAPPSAPGVVHPLRAVPASTRSAQAAGRGSKRKWTSADLAAASASVVRELLRSAQAAGRGSK